jgi:hypothetical protein
MVKEYSKQIFGTVLAAFLGLQSWTLKEVVSLKSSVAVLDARVASLAQSQSHAVVFHYDQPTGTNFAWTVE